jgi:hypothetical protein
LSGRKLNARAANRWLICAIAEELALTAGGASCRFDGALYVEKLSWPNVARAGDDVELKIEVLDKHVSASGASGFVRWRWILATTAGDKVLELLLPTMLEERSQAEKEGGTAAPMAYKVSAAAAMLGISRYVYMKRFAYKNSALIDPARDPIS